MKINASKLWLLACICFFLSGAINIVSGKYSTGFMFISLAAVYFVLSRTLFKGMGKQNQVEISKVDYDKLNIELKELISKGLKIQAIKKYRVATGLGLKEAKDYVDLLSEEN